MTEDRSGTLLVCSHLGLLAYDGRNFRLLGQEQGLGGGGRILSSVTDASGRVAVTYDDRVRVSGPLPGPSGSPETLSFRTVDTLSVPFHGAFRDLAAWRGTVAVLADGLPYEIDPSATAGPRLVAIPYSTNERAELRGGSALFDVQGVLWEARSDGALCRADPGTVRCLGAADGLAGGPWFDIVRRDQHTLLARSATSLATISTPSFTTCLTMLPDQAGPLYGNYLPHLGLFRTPDGSFATQSSHGILLIDRSGIRALDASEGIPPGVITTMMTDRSGQFWIAAFGRGLYRALGFDEWDTIRDGEGLTDGIPWQAVRAPGGAIWVTTDTGLVTVDAEGERLKATTRVVGTTYALAVDRSGRIWTSFGNSGPYVLDPKTGAHVLFGLPPVDVIVPVDGADTMIATERGLFLAKDVAGTGGATHWNVRRISAGIDPIPAMTADGAGGVFYATRTEVRHRHADGTDVAIALPPPYAGVRTGTMSAASSGDLWLGGDSGSLRVRLRGDRVVGVDHVQPNGPTGTFVETILVDHRGWVWIGSSAGVMAFDGKRWSAVTTNDGLLWNDVSQGGISEDTDGSIWITTAAGIAHLRHPEWIFDRDPVGRVTTTMTLGARVLKSDKKVAFTTDPLTLQFGTPDFGAEQSIVFRYHLDGVDRSWAETDTGAVRYPSLPFGRHLLSVYAYDTETHVASPKIEISIRMQAPWWRRWWAETGDALLAVLVVYGLYRLRVRVLYARQHELERLVAERTKDMRAAQVALERLAVTDGLTGLFNRKEAERFTSAILAEPRSDGEKMAVALVDVDHFKRVNDAHGHLGGDAVLRSIGHAAAETVAPGELAARMGGEEFLLVLRGSDEHVTERIARFHERVRRTVIVHEDRAIGVTCSIGLTLAVEQDSWESLISRADMALYRAKAGGRDRIVARPAGPKAELRLVGR